MRVIGFRNQLVYRFGGDRVPVPACTSTGLTFSSLNQALIERLFAAGEDAWRLRQYPSLLQAGCRGFILADTERWAAVQWISTPESAPPPHIPAHAARGRYWCFNEHTREGFRRRGLWRELKLAAFHEMSSNDPNFLSNLFSDTEAINAGSRAAHEAFGFVPAGVVKSMSFRIPALGQWVGGVWFEDMVHVRVSPKSKE